MYRRLTMLIAVVALVAAACGDDGSGSDDVASLSDVVVSDTAAAGGEEAPVDSEQALLDFTQCMRDSGVDMDDPTVDADGNLRLSRPSNLGGDANQADRDAIRAARDTCGELLEGAALGFRDIDRTALEDTLLEYAACMRDNGYDMQDPDFTALGPGAGPGGGGPLGEIDPEDPAFVAADQVCGEIRAGFGPGRGGAPRGGGGDG